MEPFIHLDEYLFVICIRCKIRVIANEVAQHIKRHGDISCQQAKSIDQIVKAIPACNHCRYVGRQLQRIQRHCRTQHGWVNDRKHGRCNKESAKELAPVPWRVSVPCQRMFPKKCMMDPSLCQIGMLKRLMKGVS